MNKRLGEILADAVSAIKTRLQGPPRGPDEILEDGTEVYRQAGRTIYLIPISKEAVERSAVDVLLNPPQMPNLK